MQAKYNNKKKKSILGSQFQKFSDGRSLIICKNPTLSLEFIIWGAANALGIWDFHFIICLKLVNLNLSQSKKINAIVLNISWSLLKENPLLGGDYEA